MIEELRTLLRDHLGREMNMKERFALSKVEKMIDEAIQRRDWPNSAASKR